MLLSSACGNSHKSSQAYFIRRTLLVPPLQELAPIQQMLPEELLLLIFSKLPSYGLGPVQCTCKQWKAVSSYQSLWKAACMEAFPGVQLRGELQGRAEWAQVSAQAASEPR